MAGAITSTGIGSGIKIGELVDALVASEKAAKQNQITAQKTKNDASVSGVSQLKSALSTFQTTMDGLKSSTSSAFNAFVASSSDETSIKATASSTAVGGTYRVEVQDLATASKVATVALDATQASAIPSGELTISQNGINTKVNIAATSTLQQVRDQINASMQGKGISANIVNDANGARLVFTSTTTGLNSDISVKGDSSIGTLLDIDGKQLMSATGVPGNPGAGAITGLAQDAKFTIDGLTLTSSKNKVEGAISGLTLELTAENKPTTITVASNTDGLKTSLQSFVDSYNNLVKVVSSLTTRTINTDGTVKSAALSGDSTANNLLAMIRKEFTSSSSTTGLGSLSQLGINTKSDGTLELNSVKFTAAVNDKQMGSKIQGLFTGSTGLIERIGKAIEPFTKTGGILALKSDSLGRVGRGLTADQEALDRRIETLTATLTKKYNAMDLIVAQLKATGTNITSIFEAMNAQKNAS